MHTQHENPHRTLRRKRATQWSCQKPRLALGQKRSAPREVHQAREAPLNAWTKRWPKGHARNPTLHLDKGGGCGAPRTPLSTEERPTPEKEGSPPRQTGRIGATSSMHPGCPKHAVGALCTPKAFCTHEVARLVASETKAHRGDIPARTWRTEHAGRVHAPRCTPRGKPSARRGPRRPARTVVRTKVHTRGKVGTCAHQGGWVTSKPHFEARQPPVKHSDRKTRPKGAAAETPLVTWDGPTRASPW